MEDVMLRSFSFESEVSCDIISNKPEELFQVMELEMS